MKIIVLLTGSTLLCLGASFRCGTLWLPPVPRSQPLPPYFHRAYFYVFNFGLEILVVYLYAIVRVDLLFHVPDGCQGSFEAPPHQPLVTPANHHDAEIGGAGQESKFTNMMGASSADSQTDLTALPPLPVLPPPSLNSSYRNSGGARNCPLQSKKHAPAKEKREWRKSEQERIIKRLGGPRDELD